MRKLSWKTAKFPCANLCGCWRSRIYSATCIGHRLYVCKAIEYIHRRLLGRPTYGRQENNKYFDIASKKGFYAVVDAIIDSWNTPKLLVKILFLMNAI